MKKFLKVLPIVFICVAIVIVTMVNKDEKPKNNEPLHVLIVGVDKNSSTNSEDARTDSMIVATIDPSTKNASAIFIPRDTKVAINGHKAVDKINHAYVYGGIDLSMETVKDLLGIPVDYYVKINYESLEKIVNSVNGVQIDVPCNMNYEDIHANPPLNIAIKKGKQILDGNQAMQFLRFRKGYKNQDLGRIDATKIFVEALADKLVSSENIGKLPNMLETFHNYVDTNIPASKMKDYAFYAKDIDFENVKMITLPGKPGIVDNLWYYIPDTQKINEMVQQVIEKSCTVASSSK